MTTTPAPDERLLTRPTSRLSQYWHERINKLNDGRIGKDGPDGWMHWPYLAKTLADEVPRMALLHAMERKGELTKTHVQCHHESCDTTPVPVPDNHLTCALGVKCRECPHLLALRDDRLSPEEQDYVRAWTCAAHMLEDMKGQDQTGGEGWIVTTDDRMYWDRVYRNMSSEAKS